MLTGIILLGVAGWAWAVVADQGFAHWRREARLLTGQVYELHGQIAALRDDLRKARAWSDHYRAHAERAYGRLHIYRDN